LQDSELKSWSVPTAYPAN